MNYGDESRHTNWCKNTTGTQRKIKQGDAHHTHADAPVTRACKPIRASCARSTGHEWTPNYNNNKINENYINLISFCINIPWLIVMVCRVTLAQHTHFFPFFFFVFFPFSRLASFAAKGSMRAFFYCYCWLILFFFLCVCMLICFAALLQMNRQPSGCALSRVWNDAKPCSLSPCSPAALAYFCIRVCVVGLIPGGRKPLSRETDSCISDVMVIHSTFTVYRIQRQKIK